MRRRATRLIVVLTSLWLAASAAVAGADEINLYSTREAPLVEPVIASFTAATGIKVNLTYVEDNLVKRVTAEGDASPADVLMTIGLDKTSQFVTGRLTQTITSPVLDSAIPRTAGRAMDRLVGPAARRDGARRCRARRDPL